MMIVGNKENPDYYRMCLNSVLETSLNLINLNKIYIIIIYTIYSTCDKSNNAMRAISYLMSYGKHYFDIDEVGKEVFQGSLGFRSDIKQYSFKHKTFGQLRQHKLD